MCYARYENSRVQWYRSPKNQRAIRAELYQGIRDALLDDASATPQDLGTRIVLGSKFVFGPRYMHQLYQDAMAIAREYGKPDYLITSTCSPEWPGIKENLLEGQTAADRPDLCSIVFKMYVDHLLDLLLRKHWLGRVKSYIYLVQV